MSYAAKARCGCPICPGCGVTLIHGACSDHNPFIEYQGCTCKTLNRRLSGCDTLEDAAKEPPADTLVSAEDRAKFIHKAYGPCAWCRQLAVLPHTIECLSADGMDRFDICAECHATKIIEGTTA